MNAMQQSKTVLVASFQMTPDSLRELGLREADVPEIQQVAQRIEVGSPQAVAEFGRDVADHTSRYADSLLDQVRNSDLDEAGEKLTQVVAKARSLNIGALSDNRSRVPVIGPLIDRFRVRSTAFMARFDTTREQIERLVGDVQATQQSITQRNASLDDMFVAVREEHRLLGVHIAAGKLRLAELGAQAESLRGSLENDPGRVQELADLDAMLANLDKRIGDLIALQHSAMQSLPTIRMIQANNQMLVDKFHTIREITVPAWKRQFMLALSLNEQKNAVELATAIDDTTNDLMKRNAALLHRTSVETAKENQRLVIDVDTLKQVQTTLIKTVEDVLRIQQEGVQKRKDAEKQIAAMRGDLQAKFTRQPARVLPQQEGA